MRTQFIISVDTKDPDDEVAVCIKSLENILLPIVRMTNMILDCHCSMRRINYEQWEDARRVWKNIES